MKKNVMMRVASALLVAVLLTTCAISGTFAKYVSTAEGTDAARVAKWDIKLEGDTMQKTNTLVFDLFNTVNDTVDGNAETEVEVGVNETIIAPGTQGSFEINLTNDSEVDAKYAIAYSMVETADIPLQFKVEGGEWKDDIADLSVTDVALDMDADAAVVVYWQWVFEAGADDADTDLGLKGTDTVTVTAEVTATQVD